MKSTKHGMIGIYSVSRLISLHALIHINTVSVSTDNFRLGVAFHSTTLKLDPTYARNTTTPASNTSFYSMQYSQERLTNPSIPLSSVPTLDWSQSDLAR